MTEDNKTEAIKVYLTAEEKARVEAEAAKSGYSLSRLLYTAFVYLTQSDDYQNLFH